MSKRKFILICFMLTVATGVGIWGTSAYFVAEEKAHNIITSSSVSIDLVEETNLVSENGNPVPFSNIKNAMPGETYSKIPKVKNSDSSEAWIRIKIEKSVTLVDGSTAELPENSLSINLDTENWIEQDGYFYYSKSLKPTEMTEPLFTTLTLSKELENEFMNAKFMLDLKAEAVQVANNGSDVFTANGWPEG